MAKGGRQPGAGRPKGSTTKPRISDYLSQKDIDEIVAKARDMAKAGSEAMIKLIVEQNFGKPAQAVELTGKDGKDLIPTTEIEKKAEEAVKKYLNK